MSTPLTTVWVATVYSVGSRRSHVHQSVGWSHNDVMNRVAHWVEENLIDMDVHTTDIQSHVLPSPPLAPAPEKKMDWIGLDVAELEKRTPPIQLPGRTGEDLSLLSGHLSFTQLASALEEASRESSRGSFQPRVRSWVADLLVASLHLSEDMPIGEQRDPYTVWVDPLD